MTTLSRHTPSPPRSSHASDRTFKYIAYAIIFIVGSARLCFGMDDSHFYRARTWPGEPRTPKQELWSFDTTLMGTSTHTSRNRLGEKAPLLGIYGSEDTNLLGINTGAAQLAYAGSFSLFEAQFQGYFNFSHGIFAHIHLPFRSIRLEETGLKNTHANRNCSYNTISAATQRLDDIFKTRGIDTDTVKKNGIGDLSILAGWSRTTYDSRAVDFFDVALQTGILFPTGKKKNPHALFDIPLGYNGHFALPVIVDMSTGILGWLNFGAHLESRFFFNSDEYIRPVAKQNQSGIVRLADPQKVRMHSGPLWNMSVYIKADHCMRGFSFIMGYSHDQKQKDRVEYIISGDRCVPDRNYIYQHDPFLDHWNMNILHALMEYDWATEDNPYGPRIGLEYNYVINGENIFNGSTTAEHIGLDCDWSF